jgi:hypothetical protein
MPVIEAQCASILVAHDHRHINQNRVRGRGRWDRPMAAQVHGRWMPGTSGVHGRSISVTSSVRVRLWLGALGQRLCLLVCAGQAVLRTVSVAVRGMGCLDARVHGHIADRVGAADPEWQRLCR